MEQDRPQRQKSQSLFAVATEPTQAVLPAVTLSISKRKGTNAITVADHVIEKVTQLRGSLIPGDVHVATTRNYGETAAEKSNELLLHMMIAIISGLGSHLVGVGYSRIRNRGNCDTGDAGADARRLLFLRLHAQSHHAASR
jgi:hypothetical protein